MWSKNADVGTVDSAVPLFLACSLITLNDVGFHPHCVKYGSDVLKSLEESRGAGVIGSAQEASVKLEILNPEIKAIYNTLPKVEKTRLFIVSSIDEVENLDAKTYEVSKVLVEKHTGVRCERCWNRFEEGELDENHLCSRCHDVIEALENE